MTVGQRINFARLDRGMTIDELAEKSLVPKDTINAWIYRGYNPHLVAFIAVADVLDMSLDELAGRKERKDGRRKVD